MTIDRKFNRFCLKTKPKILTGDQAPFLYALVVELGGEPGKARWLTFTEVANAAERKNYVDLLDPAHDVTVPESVYHWLNKWSLKGFMVRNEP